MHNSSPEFPDAVVARLVDLGLRVVHRPPDRAELHVVGGCAAAGSAGLAHAVDLDYSCGFQIDGNKDMIKLSRLQIFLPDVQRAEEFCRFLGKWCRSRSNLLDFIQTQTLLDRRVHQLYAIVTNMYA